MKRYSFLFTILSAALILFLAASAAGPGLAAPALEPDDPPTQPAPGDTDGPGTEPTPEPPVDPARADSKLPRIQFEAGATSALVSGQVDARKTVRYVLRARGEQLMEVTVTSPKQVTLTVTTARGRILTAEEENDTSFRGYLPASGEYILEVTSVRRATPFSLWVSIPQRITFAKGATSAVLSSSLKAEKGLEYILHASKGQLLDLSVSTPETTNTDSAGPIQLVIYGVDGTVLRSGMGEGSAFRGEIPSSQDYLVKVRAGNRAVSFTMNVIIPKRVQFETGEISARLRGSLDANQTQYYVLRARRNQTLQVRVRSAEPVQLIVYGVDGTVLKSGTATGTGIGAGTDETEIEAALTEVVRFTSKLVKTQDYIVAVRAGAQDTAYRLRVTIQ